MTRSQVPPNRLIVTAIAIVIIGALGFRVWAFWPQELPNASAFTKLQKIVKRGGEYLLYPEPNASLSDIVSLRVFEGYNPRNHNQFQQKLLEERPARAVNSNDRLMWQVMGQYGRFELYEGYSEGFGTYKGLDFFPTDLAVDEFLNKYIAIALDITQPEFKVYILPDRDRMTMTIDVKSRKIDRIYWGLE